MNKSIGAFGGYMSVSNTHFGANRISKMLKKCKSIFFCGIGGINVSSLAHISLVNGMRVGGSDRTPSALTRRLALSLREYLIPTIPRL